MHVELLAVTPNAERVCSVAALGCYSEHPASKLITTARSSTCQRVLRDIVASGHHSVIEHAVFTFSIEGISRSCSHQLVRHRLASYSQQSQRYVEFDELTPIVPPAVADHTEARAVFDSTLETVQACYQQLLALGIEPEDARFVLPNAAPTNIVVTMNARELNHFITLRSCTRSQWEIRAVAIAMLECVREKTPTLFENAGPPCARGPCPEGKRSCGQPWSERKEVPSERDSERV